MIGAWVSGLITGFICGIFFGITMEAIWNYRKLKKSLKKIPL